MCIRDRLCIVQSFLRQRFALYECWIIIIIIAVVVIIIIIMTWCKVFETESNMQCTSTLYILSELTYVETGSTSQKAPNLKSFHGNPNSIALCPIRSSQQSSQFRVSACGQRQSNINQIRLPLCSMQILIHLVRNTTHPPRSEHKYPIWTEI